MQFVSQHIAYSYYVKFFVQIIIQPQSAATTGSPQLQLVGGQLVQMPSGQTVVYQPTQQADTGTQQQQIQTIQLQAPGMPGDLHFFHIHYYLPVFTTRR